ncbi:MAG: HEAT repeat domain-containing protein [Chloroflexota bacterium]
MEIGEYLDELEDGSRKLRVAGLQRLSELNGEDRKVFDKRWPHIDVRRRRRLVQEIIDVAEDNVHLNFDSVFLRGLSDDDAEVRLESVRGLWEHESPGLIGTLAELLELDGDPAVRAEAALALGRYVLMFETGRIRENQYQRAEDALRKAVENKNETEEVHARAIEAIGARDIPWVRQALREAYESGEHRLKVSAVHAMGRSAENRWLPLLSRELASDEGELRYEAAMATGQIGDETAIPQLLPLLTDEDDDVREAATAALGEIGGEHAKMALMEMLDSSSTAAREAAAAALAELEFEEDPLGFKFR